MSPSDKGQRMNQRIRELAEQAGIVPGIMGLNRYTHFDPEKFAELIVQECCQKLEDDGMVEVAMEMKQHFGVEE